ncbi:hypothetical protein ACSBR2_009563 [Camellia fascicularis]
MVIRDKHPPPPHPKAKQPTTPSLKTMKTNYLCMPKFKAAATTSASCGRKNRRLSPMTLLDRIREAVFRLIMLSALSKAAQQSSKTGSSSSSGGGDYHVHRSCYYAPHDDPHHSEAVADCIEFIKKSATTTDSYDENRDSSASSSFVDADTEPAMIIPVPFM